MQHGNDQIQLKATQVSIQMVEGEVAPRYPESSVHLLLERVVITEQGTEAKLPLVDLVMKDKDGKEHYVMMTGRILNMISAAVKGSNLRNHGVEEP